MSKIIGNLFYITPEPTDKCEECGNVAELRPYGKDGKRICIECAEKDWDEVQERMREQLEKADCVVYDGAYIPYK